MSTKIRGAFYVSEATRHLNDDEIDDIQKRAAEANAEIGVTGILVSLRNRFFQFIEGPEDSTIALLARIANDERHRFLRSCSEWTSNERQFPGWAMHRLADHDVTAISAESLLFGKLLSWEPSKGEVSLGASLHQDWSMTARGILRAFAMLEQARRRAQ